MSLADVQRTKCYLCLTVGMVLVIFSNGIFAIVPVATWLAPVFLLRFLRTQHPLVGFVVFVPLHIIAWIIMLFGILPDLGIIGNAFGVVYGLIFVLPYAVDRAVTPRLRGFLSTLIFPFSLVVVEYVLAVWDVTGSWFSLAYTQHDNLPLVQLVSVTGLWGVTFLIAWFASVANWAWESDFSFAGVWRGWAAYAVVFLAVHLFGGAYLVFAPTDSQTVRVASVTRSFDMDVEAGGCRGDETCLRRLFDKSLAEFLFDSQQAVDGGGNIILWQENGVAVYAADEESYVDTAREFAVRESIYLVMGVKVVAEDDHDDENKAIVISPEGEVSEYFKTHRSPGDNHVRGHGSILLLPSEYGTLGTIICRDFDYPSYVRQAGMAGVDIMLIPSHDWQAVNPDHARMAHFRAIENGFSMVSANYHGTSAAVDFHGNALGLMDDFATDARILFSDIPTQGIQTVYATIGDLFAWLCGAALLGLILVGWRQVPHSRD